MRSNEKGWKKMSCFWLDCCCCCSIPISILSWIESGHRIPDNLYIPNQIELFSLSQCSSSGRILMSSIIDNGFSSGKVSSRRCSGSLNCHVNSITKSIDSSPATIVYSFHGSTFFCSIRIEIENEWKDEINKWNPTQIEEQLIMARIYILICWCSVKKRKKPTNK